MAGSGYGCTWGDCGNQVAYIITILTQGETVSLCAEHYAPGLIPVLAGELGVDAHRFYAEVERFLKYEEKRAAKELAAAQAAAAEHDQAGVDDQADDDQAGNDPTMQDPYEPEPENYAGPDVAS